MLRHLRDDLTDVLRDLHSRRGRSALLVAAVALSTGALVASVGVSTTASMQVGADLAARILDEVTVTAALSDGGIDGPLFPPDAQQRATAVPMVISAGLRLDLDVATARPSRFASGPALRELQVFGATAEYLDAVGSPIEPDVGWALGDAQPYDVVVLGASAAALLGVPESVTGPGVRIYVNGHPAEVIANVGTADDEKLAHAVIVPYHEAVRIVGGDGGARMVAATEVGAGAAVAAVLRSAIRPDRPTALSASRVVDLQDTRRGVQSRLARLAGATGALLLTMTGLLMANAMVVSVVGRLPEIGLRRALGASRWAVMRVFLLEGGVVGALGGLGGAVIGLWSVVVVSAVSGWTAQMSPGLVGVGFALGVGIGLLGSGYPALRAARVNLAEAVRFE